VDIHEAIRERRSVRAFKNLPVEEEKLNLVLEAARLAPSASNRQPWKFVVVQEPSTREDLAKAAFDQKFVAEAPVVIVAVALQPEVLMGCQVPSYPVDLAIAVDHMTLAATGESLGTCWIGAFDQEKVRKILEIPETFRVVALLPLGYPADVPRPKRRKTLGEITCFERFG
jgi:nitroreductase